MNLILFGAPGAGKGTQSELLVQRRGMKQISTGDLFRSAIKAGTPLGKEAKGYLDSGKLVPDSITIGLIDDVLAQLKGQSFILDGFPRNVAQADALAELLKVRGLRLDRSIFVEVPMTILLNRLAGRRVCKNCGTVYHVSSKPPHQDGVCDKCGGPVIQRPDDAESVVKTRLAVYETNTQPLRDYYRKLGQYCEIDGVGSSEEVFARLEKGMATKVLSH